MKKIAAIVLLLSVCLYSYAQSWNEIQHLIDNGDFEKARSQILSTISETSDPIIISQGYEMIGDMYFASYEKCRIGESKVEDRALFSAAADMYEMAGNVEKLNKALNQCPSIEELFTETYREGEYIYIKCWINLGVNIRQRPR